MGEFKNWFKPDPNRIINSFYSDVIKLVFSATIGWVITQSDPFGLAAILSQINPVFIWVGISVTLFVVMFIVIRFFKWIWQRARNILSKQSNATRENRELPSAIDLQDEIEGQPSLVNISSLARESGKYVSLKVTSKNGEAVLCRATKKRLERSTKDTSYGWKRIDDNEDLIFSWHLGGTTPEGFREVGSLPEYVNIAKIPDGERLIDARNIIFTYLDERPHIAGRYRMCIEVVCKTGSTIRTERWFGCIETDVEQRRLAIMECEDVNEWKK